MSGADLASMLPALLPRLWALALRLSGDQHDAEDLVQRSCVRGLERAWQLRPGTAPLSWMYSIVYSTWISELRARSVRKRASFEWDDDYLENLPEPVDNGPEKQFMRREIIDAVERLPEAQRVVMQLVAVEGLTYQQAADVLKVPIGTVMSRLSRARQSVGALFGSNAQCARRSTAKGFNRMMR